MPPVSVLAERVGGRVVGGSDATLTNFKALSQADAGSLTFVRSGEYLRTWLAGPSPVAIVAACVPLPGAMDAGKCAIVVDDPDYAVARVLELLAAPPQLPPVGVHPSASVHGSASVHPSARIGPGCVVGEAARVEADAALVSYVSVARGASIGKGSVLHHAVCVQEGCVVGARCTLHPGVVIGADGFGYAPAPDGKGLHKIPHIGNVVIGENVEIGANACIDRAKFGSTAIGAGTKIDNLVQIGHNCDIGRCCVICGLVGIAGSVTIGDGAQVGGGAKIGDNLTIGAGARVGGASGIMRSVPAGETWFGYPAMPAQQQLRAYTILKKLADLPGIARQIERVFAGGTRHAGKER